MFINKIKENSVSDSSKMSSYINLFLKTEVTCIPKLLKNYIGDYYNNALFNGATWVFVLWCVLHITFDKLIDAFLKKLRYREYARLRLRNSLWYLGFFGTALVYSGATLAQNDVELFNFKKMHVPSSSNLPSQVVIGYTLISTFFLHSSLWEGLAKEYFLNMSSYLLLFLFLISSYILRIVEISFSLTALIGMTQVAVEFTRCCFMSLTHHSFLSKLFLGLVYFTTFLICFAVYIVVIPLTFIVPLGLKILSDYPNILLLFLFFNLVLWLIVEIYQSVLFKLMDHWFYHQKQTKNVSEESESEQDDGKFNDSINCSTGLLECSLFKPRDDISYNLQIIKKEIKARQAKMMSMRKPKKTMLLQTLKCMVAVKRKLNKKRRSSDSSDSESEKSEDSDLKISENGNTDEENGGLLSSQDDETDDESQDTVLGKEENDTENNKLDSDEEDNQNKESNIDLIKSENDRNCETENNSKEGCSKSKSPSSEELDEENNSNKFDNNNKYEYFDVKSNIIVNKDGITQEVTATINKGYKNNNPSLQQGDINTVQTVEEEAESKYETTKPLLVKEHDIEEIGEVKGSEDNDNNNSVLTKDDNTVQTTKENINNNQVLEKLKVNVGEKNEEVY